LFVVVGVYVVGAIVVAYLFSAQIPIGANSFFICLVGAAGFGVRIRSGQLEDKERHTHDEEHPSTPPEG
jgi:hypothetical protein